MVDRPREGGASGSPACGGWPSPPSSLSQGGRGVPSLASVGTRRGEGFRHTFRGALRACPRAGGRLLGAAAHGCRGGLLMEAVLAVAVFTLVGTAVLSGLSSAHSSGAAVKRHSVAEAIARNQMEHVFSLPYQDPPTTYPTIATPERYSVTAEGEEYVVGDPNIQQVVVTVYHDATELLVLEALRTR